MSMDELKGKAQQAAGRVQEAAGDAFDDNESRVKGRVRQGAGHVQSQYGETVDRLRDFAQDKPLQAIGLAALAGMVIGRIFKR